MCYLEVSQLRESMALMKTMKQGSTSSGNPALDEDGGDSSTEFSVKQNVSAVKRKVRFAMPEEPKVRPLHKQVEEDCSDNVDEEGDPYLTWYSPQEYKNMKLGFIHDAKLAARANRATDGVLLKTFKLCGKGEGALNRDILEQLHLCLQQYELTGLERMAARRIFQDKQYRRCTLLETVFSIQERHGNADSRANALRFACESVSFSSVLFAHQLALALAPRQ